MKFFAIPLVLCSGFTFSLNQFISRLVTVRLYVLCPKGSLQRSRETINTENMGQTEPDFLKFFHCRGRGNGTITLQSILYFLTKAKKQ